MGCGTQGRKAFICGAVKIQKKTAIDSKMKTIKTTIRIEGRVYTKYKNFCKENGLVIAKRLEDFMRADLEKRLIKIPEVKL